MKNEYDLSKMQLRKNPHVSKLKKPVTLRLGEDVIDYFEGVLEEHGFQNSLTITSPPLKPKQGDFAKINRPI